MITLPDYLVRKVSNFPAGIKLNEFTKFQMSYPSNDYKVIGGSLYPGTGDGDPLSGGDYRYWCGAYGSHWRKGYANCRGCGELCFTKSDRKTHKNLGCGARLEEAYKMLRRSNECIICTLNTNRKVYGLPMCCKDCEHEWEYTTGTPGTLRIILLQLKDKEKKS